METIDPADSRFSSSNLLIFALKHWRPLLIVSLSAFVISIVVSLLITPLYRSTVVMFPASNVSVSEALVSTSGSDSRTGVLSFGEEEETEQLLQILNSDEIKEKLIEKFNLFEHYGIDPESKIKYTLLYSKMKKYMSFKKTEYMSVRIEVLDEDPQMAADIANEMASLLDSTINRMRQKRAVEAFKIVAEEYHQLEEEIAALEDSLRKIGQLGIYDVEAQSQGLNEAWLAAQESGNRELVNKLEKQIRILGEHGGDYLFLKEFLKNESDRLSRLKDKYTRARVDVEQKLPHVFIVNQARVAERKSVPKRSYIVILSTASAFLFAFFALIVMDSLRKHA
jgi:uncharacterized protein involved in exopolysaccharide biosynthesis